MSGQSEYDWPDDFLLPLTVAVAGWPWEASDRETVRQYERGELSLQARGVWYESIGSDGTRKLALYPTPGGEDTLEVEWVYEAADLSTDEPAAEPSEFPKWFHPKLKYFVDEIYFNDVEDNPELAEVQKSKADLALSELVRHENERSAGDGIFTVPIAGWTA